MKKRNLSAPHFSPLGEKLTPFVTLAECRPRGSDKRIRILRRNRNQTNDSAENQDHLREEPVGPEDRLQRAVVRGAHPGSARQKPNHRRSVASFVRHTIIGSANNVKGRK